MKIKEREKYVKHQKNMIKKFNSCVNLAKKKKKNLALEKSVSWFFNN
jgi:hypothetical protein